MKSNSYTVHNSTKPFQLFFTRYVSKIMTNARSPLKVSKKNVLFGFFGGFLCIGFLALLSDLTSSVWIMAPFGASCVLVFGLWDAAVSQPRNIVGGHLLSTFIGLTIYHLFGQGIWQMGIGVGLAISLMIVTKTTHPPAGANPIVVILAGSDWTFLFSPVAIGSLSIVLLALLINNFDAARKYPMFWI